MSLRTKQAVILLLATVLPFLLGGAATSFVVAPAYRRTAARFSQETTERLAEHVAWNLARDVSRLQRLAAEEALRELARGSQLSDASTVELDRLWSRLPPESPLLRHVTENPVAQELLWWRTADPSILELFATDARGRVIASSGRTDDFTQEDEVWWKQAYAQGRGQVYLSDITFDRGKNRWVIQVAVPIHAEAVDTGPALGVLKATHDTSLTFRDVERAPVGQRGDAMLVDRRGLVVVGPAGDGPMSSFARQPKAFQLRDQAPGSRFSPDENAIISWAPVPLARQLDVGPVRTPALFVVTRRSTAETLGPLRSVQAWMIGIALTTILAAVLLGYWLADLWLVRPIRTLAAGMRELAHGDFGRAAAIGEELLRSHAPEPSGDGDIPATSPRLGLVSKRGVPARRR